MLITDLRSYTEETLKKHVKEEGGPHGLVPPWLDANNLRPLLRDAQASNKSVRMGVPLMELPKVSVSCPSLDTRHARAALQEQDDQFRLIDESGHPRQPVKSSVWLDLDITSGIKLRHTAEASVQSYVVSVLKDVIYGAWVESCSGNDQGGCHVWDAT